MHRSWIRVAASLPLLVLSICCGGGNGSTTERKQPVVLGTQSFNVEAGDGTALGVEVQSAGALGASATWSEPGAQIDVYITDGSCAGLDELVLGSCRVLARGDAQGAKLQMTTASGVQPGRYQAFVLDVGQKAASGTVEFTLSQ